MLAIFEIFDPTIVKILFIHLSLKVIWHWFLLFLLLVLQINDICLLIEEESIFINLFLLSINFLKP